MPEISQRLEVEALDLGMGVRGVLLELVERETREPVVGLQGARIWAAAVSAIAGDERWAFDFFAHLERVREFCLQRNIPFRDGDIIVIEPSNSEMASIVIERFEGETFGIRAGAALAAGDEPLEGMLAARGVDAYQEAYTKYAFCAICDFANGFLTVLSDSLWASEVIRRARNGLEGSEVEVTRPA